MNMKDREGAYLEAHRGALIRSEEMDRVVTEKLTIKQRLEVRRRANAGEDYLTLLAEYGIT